MKDKYGSKKFTLDKKCKTRDTFGAHLSFKRKKVSDQFIEDIQSITFNISYEEVDCSWSEYYKFVEGKIEI